MNEDEKKSYDKGMQELVQKYKRAFPEKVRLIEKLAAEFMAAPNNKNLKDLYEEIHKIAGSAGMYGLMEVSTLSKAFNAKLKEWQKDIDTKLPTKEELKSLNEYIEKIKKISAEIGKEPLKEEVKKEPVKEKVPTIIKKTVEKEEFNLDLYIADCDIDTLQLVQKEGQIRGLNIEIGNSTDEVFGVIEKSDFKPRVFIVGVCITKEAKMKQIENPHYDAFEIIKKVKKNNPKTICCLIIPQASLETRLRAINEKIEYVLEKPFSYEVILNIVLSAVPAYFEKQFKVLVIDDDPDVGSMIISILKEINVDVRAITDPRQVFESLESFGPDLIFLDLVLDGVNGIEILKTIRSTSRFRDLPITIITAMGEEELVKQAYQEKVDDYILKPLVRDIVVSKVLHIASKKSFTDIRRMQDPLTGLYTKQAFRYALARRFEKITKDSKEPQSLVFLAIEKYKELVDQLGQHKLNDIIVQLSNLFRLSFRAHDLIGIFPDGIFAIYLDGVDGKKAQSLIFDFFQKLSILVPLKEQEAKLRLVSGISTFPHDGTTSQELLQKAEEYLKQALEKGREAIVSPSSSFEEKKKGGPKEVFIMDDDPDICSVLSYAFGQKGFKVIVKENIKDTLAYFQNKERGKLPDLVILDRLLPDGDGLEMYKRLKKEFVSFPPVLFLTKLSAEKDVMAALREGAVDYVPKPFNINLLMEKAINLLEASGK